MARKANEHDRVSTHSGASARVPIGIPPCQPKAPIRIEWSTVWRAPPVPSWVGPRHDRSRAILRVGSVNCVAARLVTFPEAHFEAAHISPFILSMSAPELCTPRAFKICVARFRRMMSTAAVTPKITRSRIVILHWFPATRAMSGRQ